MKKKLVLTLLVLLLNSCYKKEMRTPVNNFQGSWFLKAVHFIADDRTVSLDPAQPGVFIFDKSAYSIQWAPVKEPRTAFNVLSKPSDEEAIAGFKSVVFNAGTYEFIDRRITTRAMIAKVPGFEGGQQFYKYHFEENRLILTMYDEIYPDETKPEWSGKYQTQFVLERMK